MPKRQRNARRATGEGLTLVELIVVLSIIALISAVALPGIIRMTSNRDTLSQESRKLFEMLSAARIYAATWNVRTAVVYNLDNYQSPLQNLENTPLVGGDSAFTTDSVSNRSVRFIDAACMVYELPSSETQFSQALDYLFTDPEPAFVPMFGNEGNWRRFEDDVVMLLKHPRDINQEVYYSTRPRFQAGDDTDGGYSVNDLGLYLGVPVILDYERLQDARLGGAPADQQAQHIARFVGHVFNPDGRIQLNISGGTGFSGTKERYTFLMGYRPDSPIDVRLTNPEINSFTFPNEVDDEGYPTLNLRVVPLELNRTTGRVRIATS